MSESEKNELDDMFGEEASPQENAEVVIEIKKDSKMVEIPLDASGKAVCDEKDDDSDGNGDERPDLTAENETDGHDDVPPEKRDSASASEAKKSAKELPGGASFVDELLEQCPDILPEFKKSGKTLGGLYRWAWSFVKSEYAKCNGATTGGMWWSAKDLARRYLSPEIKEGSVIEEPKCASIAKPFVPPVTSSAPKTEKKTRKARVVAAVKRAAKAAKNDAEVAVPVITEPPKPVTPKAGFCGGFDFSKLVRKG